MKEQQSLWARTHTREISGTGTDDSSVLIISHIQCIWKTFQIIRRLLLNQDKEEEGVKMGHTVLPIMMAILSHCIWENVEVGSDRYLTDIFDNYCDRWRYSSPENVYDFADSDVCKCSYRYHHVINNNYSCLFCWRAPLSWTDLICKCMREHCHLINCMSTRGMAH